MSASTAWAIMWISVCLTISYTIGLTGNWKCLWFLLIPACIGVKTSPENEEKKERKEEVMTNDGGVDQSGMSEEPLVICVVHRTDRTHGKESEYACPSCNNIFVDHNPPKRCKCCGIKFDGYYYSDKPTTLNLFPEE